MLAVLDRVLRLRDQAAIEHFVDAMILPDRMIDRVALPRRRLEEQPGEIEAVGLGVGVDLGAVEHLPLADHFVELAVAELGHDRAHFFGDEEEEVDDVLGLAGEALAQHRILGGDADRAGVEMALAHHDAAGRDQRRGGEAELVGAEQGADHDVAARAHAAVDLHRDARAKAVEHERLVGFGEADFPWRARVLQRRQRRGAGAALEARDRDVVGLALGDAGGHRADADFGDELDRNQRVRVDVLQVEHELLQVFDRIDVVMGRRRDQADARGRVAHLGDDRVDLVPRQLAALAGLCALRHLDLHHVGVDEIFGGDAEPPARHLLDGAAHRIAVGHPLVAVGFFAALAGVRLAADAVHRDRQRGVRLARDRAVAHRAGGEALDDVDRRFDLFDRHGASCRRRRRP